MFCILVSYIINVFIFLFIYFYTGPILIAVFITEMVILFKHVIIIIIIIRSTKKNFFYESFREDLGDSKKIWSVLKDLNGQKNHGGVSCLEENRSIQICDETAMAEVFNEHLLGLADRETRSMTKL